MSDTTRSNEPKNIKELTQNLFEGAEKADSTTQAARAWYTANGDVEHKHTVGVYLQESTKGNPPTLYVYIDSNAMIQDFSANKEIYISRLANQEFYVSDVQFKLSKYKKSNQTKSRKQQNTQVEFADQTAGIELSQEEIDGIRLKVEKLPPSIQESAFKAMVSSRKANKGLGS